MEELNDSFLPGLFFFLIVINWKVKRPSRPETSKLMSPHTGGMSNTNLSYKI